MPLSVPRVILSPMTSIASILAPIFTLLIGLALGVWLTRRSSQQTLDTTVAGAVARETAALSVELATVREQLRQQTGQTEREVERLTQVREELETRFKVLATDILDRTSQRFTEQNQMQLGTLLDPLRTRLGEFQQRVEKIAQEESEKRVELRTQIRQLTDLNAALSTDAKNLTDALRGSNKTQGNWGEQILERILETAGLLRDVHYTTQDAQTNEDGKRVQPDVVILLPDDRRIIVDSKVSLLAYQSACDASTDEERAAAIRQHLLSIRTHIKGLSAKKYPSAYQSALDCVAMFVPVEPAFLMAVTEDPALWEDAWKENVLLVSPSTLLFMLRTVAFLWQQEAQARNTRDIIDRAKKLYEKLNGFVMDLEEVGSKLDGAQRSYRSAYKKLGEGTGNTLWQAQQLIEMGVPKPRKLARGLVATTTEDTGDPGDATDIADAEIEVIAAEAALPQLGGAVS